MTRIEVDAKVTAQVGTAHLILLPARTFSDPWDEVTLPWCWMASCHIVFRIGEAQTTKKVKAKYVFPHDWGTDHEEPHAAAIALGKLRVVQELERLIGRHGFTPPELTVEVHDHCPAPLA